MSHDPSQVYAPEADTFLMLEAVRSEVRPGDMVLEIGTGSGTIACEIAQITQVIATDISPHAVACARERGADVVRTDLCSGIRGQFALVIFNPPYLPTHPDERIDDWLEYALDGGMTGHAVIERFARDAGRVLAPGGRIFLLISSLTGFPEVTGIFSRQGFSVSVAAQQAVEDEVLYVLRISRVTV